MPCWRSDSFAGPPCSRSSPRRAPGTGAVGPLWCGDRPDRRPHRRLHGGVDVGHDDVVRGPPGLPRDATAGRDGPAPRLGARRPVGLTSDTTDARRVRGGTRRGAADRSGRAPAKLRTPQRRAARLRPDADADGRAVSARGEVRRRGEDPRVLSSCGGAGDRDPGRRCGRRCITPPARGPGRFRLPTIARGNDGGCAAPSAARELRGDHTGILPGSRDPGDARPRLWSRRRRKLAPGGDRECRHGQALLA